MRFFPSFLCSWGAGGGGVMGCGRGEERDIYRVQPKSAFRKTKPNDKSGLK